jgi:AN1-type zinc finger and ubiquitin domain-containing protein 1
MPYGSMPLLHPDHLGGEDENMPPPISVTINTLLGGAFLLEVDPLTRVAQVKDMLSQMQGIPVRQQSLIYKQNVLPDEACLYECGIQDGSTMSLVLRVSSALTNVMVNEPVMETDSIAECFGFDVHSMDYLDVTGLDELEQDELLSMLFGPTDDNASRPQTFVLCRDGDKINVLQLGSAGPPGMLGADEQGLSGLGDDRGRGVHNRLPESPTLGRDGVPLQDRIRRFEENARHRKSMADLMGRMRERKGTRKSKGKMFGGEVIMEAGPAVEDARLSTPPPARVMSASIVAGVGANSAAGPAVLRHGLLPQIGQPSPDRGTAMLRHSHQVATDATPERRRMSESAGAAREMRVGSGTYRSSGGSATDSTSLPPPPTSASGRRLLPRNLGQDFARVASADRNTRESRGGTPHTPQREFSALSYSGSARSGSRAPPPPGSAAMPSARLRTPTNSTQQRLHLPALTPQKVGGASSSQSSPTHTPAHAHNRNHNHNHNHNHNRNHNHSTIASPPTNNSKANNTYSQAGFCPPAPKKERAHRTRCAHCGKKCKLATSFICRCDQTFCGQHRYAEAHDCTFDYKFAGRKMLEAASPSIATPKLPKI